MPRKNWSLLKMPCPLAVQTLSTRLSRCLVLSLLYSALFYIGQASAAEGGYSNYIPGTYGDFGMALAPTETWTLRNDIYYYGAEDDKSVRSGKIEVDADLEFLMNFTTVLYKPELTLFGGQYAAGVFVPLVKAEVEATVALGPVKQELDDKASGLGDIALIPLALYWNAGSYHWSFSQFIVTPTGSYDEADDINTSLNYWSFDTNFALTYLNEKKGQRSVLQPGLYLQHRKR